MAAQVNAPARIMLEKTGSRPDKRSVYSEALARSFCLAGASLGAIGLFGWLISSESLITIIPGEPRMMPNTAIGLLLLGIAGILLRPGAGRVQNRLAGLAALLVLAIGLATIAEYAFGLQLGLDQLLFRIPTGPFPGRPSPPTAIALSLLSAAILMFDWRPGKRARPAEWLIVISGLIAFTALLGQFFGAGPLYKLASAPTVGVAVHTATGIFLISLGLLLQRPDAGLARLAIAPGPGSVLLLRLAPWAVLAPVAVGLAGAHLLEMAVTVDVPLVFAALTVVTIFVSLLLLAITAVRLNRAHEIIEWERSNTRSLIDLASDALFVSDLSGHYVEVNEAACRMLGYSRAELMGMTIMDLILPEDVDRLWKTQAGLLEGGHELGEWTLRRKDGSEVPTEISAKILPDGRWQAFVRDITKRKLAEAALRSSEAKFSGIVSTSADAIISIDENQKIILFNEGAEKIFGRRNAEIIGAPLEILIPERFRAAHARHVASFASGPGVARRMGERNGTIVGLRGSGEEFPADAAISKLVIGGKPILTVALRDITELKEAEAAAKRATKARDDMLGVVAHDLRNPLAAVSAYAGILQRKEPDKEIGAEIAHAVARMRRLIQDLVDVTLLEAGTFTIKQERIPTEDLLSEVVASQTQLASAASLEIRLDAASDLPEIWADHDRLLQVFENLVGNALKFTKPGGQITVKATAQANDVLFSIADTGSGIEPDQLPRVFDRFWQAPGAKRKGAGLGLPIVKGIVEGHGGRIWVQSSPGHGSTFFFTIPTVQAARDVIPQAGSAFLREQTVHLGH